MNKAAAFFVFALSSPAFAHAQTSASALDPETRPNPDPTRLTLQAQERAISSLRELFQTKFDGVQGELDRQKQTLDLTDNRLLGRINAIPELLDKQLFQLQKLMEEKFKGVDQQFQGRDVALAAALLAQKTSVDEQNKANAASAAKQEGAITKQIDGIQSIITSNSKATDDRIEGVKALFSNQAKGVDDKISDMRNTISDLRTSITALTARGAGQSDLWGYMIGAGGLILAGLVLFIKMHPAPTPAPQYYAQNNGYQPQTPPPNVQVVPVVPVPVRPNN